MSTATVEIWRDTGFTEGSVEVPSKTSSLKTANFTFTGLNIPVDTLFGQFKVKHAFEDLYDCSYLRMTLDMNNGNDVVIYGWIDNVTCVSDTAGYPVTSVDWHPDLWRTYLPSATFGKGTVVRRPYNNYKDCPPQIYPHRYQYVVGRQNIITSQNIWWVVFRFVQKQKFLATQITTSCIGAFPFNMVNNTTSYTVTGEGFTESGDVSAKTIPFWFLAAGFFEEFFKMDPGQLVSVFLCPFDPFDCNVSNGTYSKPDVMVYRVQPIPSGDYYGFLVSTSANWFHEYSKTTSALMTDDNQTIAITDTKGNKVGELPWGVTVKDWKYRLVMDSSSAYINIRGLPTIDDRSFNIGTDTPIHGTSFSIPLTPVEITQNTLGSYVWSGQREADRQALQNNAMMGIVGGLGGMSNDMLQGYLFSGVAQNNAAREAKNYYVNEAKRASPAFGKTVSEMLNKGGSLMRGTMALSGIGLATTAVTSLISVGMADSQNVHRAAAQTNNLVMTGTGYDELMYGTNIQAVTVTKDAYSRGVRYDDLYNNGCTVSEASDDITPLINAGGPLQILNPVVTGSIPTPAKEYIKQRLESGVRII